MPDLRWAPILTVGSRLDELSFSKLGDYAENILGMDRRTAQAAAQLSRALLSRPLLRAGVRAGLVRPRNALAVLPVAKGEAEANWAKRASRETVRALEAAVKAERTGRTGALPGPDIAEEMAAEEEEPRIEIRLPVRDLNRPEVMEALAIAESVLESPVRYQHLEALAQEYLGSHPLDEDRVREAERITLRRRQRLPRKPDPEEEERLEREAERGGPDEPWNILPLCSFHHHRVVHGGFAEVTGRFPDSVEWVVKGKRWVDAKFGRD